MIILTSNLWNNDKNRPAWEAKGEDCSAEARIDGLVKAYTAVMPDILGFEEMSRHMEKLVFSRMSRMTDGEGNEIKYEMITGGYTPILFRYDKLRLLESGYLAYPAENPPYQGRFNDVDSKGYTFGVFEEREGGEKIIVITTHLWWMSDDPSSKEFKLGSGAARTTQILMANEKANELIRKYNCPAVLMGDLNDKLGSSCLNAAKEAGWLETHALCKGERNDTEGYHYCFGDGWRHDPPGEYKNAIDHILIKNEGKAEVERFCRFMEPFFEPLSDHFPAYIDLKL